MTDANAQSPWTPNGVADLALVQRCIPHRYPFLMIDKVRDIVPNVSAVGIKNVTYNEPQFQGHFPTFAIFPGVYIVEAMAQAAAVLVAVSRDLVDKNPLVYFMGLEETKFRRKVVPGDVLELHVSITRDGGRVYKFAGEGRVDGQVAATAQFTAMFELPKA